MEEDKFRAGFGREQRPNELGINHTQAPFTGRPEESRSERGRGGFLWNTWVNVILKPSRFFSNMPLHGDLFKVTAYAVLLNIVGIILTLPSQLMFYNRIFNQFGQVNIPFPMTSEMMWMGYLSGIILAPLWVPLSYMAVCIILHIGIRIVGGRGGLASTYKVVCYTSSVAVLNIFHIIPVIGMLVTGAYSMMVMLLGLREVNRFSTMRTIGAMLIPIILLSVGMMVLVLIAFFMGRNFLQGLMGIEDVILRGI